MYVVTRRSNTTESSLGTGEPREPSGSLHVRHPWALRRVNVCPRRPSPPRALRDGITTFSPNDGGVSQTAQPAPFGFVDAQPLHFRPICTARIRIEAVERRNSTLQCILRTALRCTTPCFRRRPQTSGPLIWASGPLASGPLASGPLSAVPTIRWLKPLPSVALPRPGLPVVFPSLLSLPVCAAVPVVLPCERAGQPASAVPCISQYQGCYSRDPTHPKSVLFLFDPGLLLDSLLDASFHQCRI